MVLNIKTPNMINIIPRKIASHSFLLFFSLKNIIPPKVATITQLWEIEKLIVTPKVLVVINIPKFATDHNTPVIRLNKTFSIKIKTKGRSKFENVN